ncbi:MAG: 30S ribosomal protein S13 [Patescibacteria group bacterium]
MARIAGVHIPNDKRIVIGLTYIYGIGRTRSEEILEEAGVDGNIRGKELSEADAGKIRAIIEKQGYKVEGDLKRDRLMDIKRLKEISSYRGARHDNRLPVRGQRTKTNSRTIRGNKRSTMGSGKTKLTKT